MALRKYQRVPVYIVEDHCDALQFILRAVGSKHLPFSGNLFIHFDSHPDLLLPPHLEASEVYKLEVLLERVSIENWILPAAYAGHLSTIVWVKPPWSNQIDEGDYSFVIGKHKENGKIGITSPLLYFVSELLYCPEENLVNTSGVNLHVITASTSASDILACEEKLCDLIQKHDDKFILDIDLDFFTTQNPFLNTFANVNMYERLKKVYKFKIEESDISILDAQLRRANQIKVLRDMFTKLQETNDLEVIKRDIDKYCETIESLEEREELKSLIVDLCHEPVPSIDWLLIHDAGCTCDDTSRDLPHHLSSNEEILELVKNVEKLLDAIPHPVLVTVARSSLDDYCPPDKVDFIQEQMCSFLKMKYDAEIKLDYKNNQ